MYIMDSLKQKLNQETLQLLRVSLRCRNKLAVELDCSGASIGRYIRNNDILLTTATALNTMSEFFEIPKEDFLEPIHETENV